MKHIGLFEGIGGFSIAARQMGWQTVAWCECNEFGQKVLRYHFPEAEGFGDITKSDFTKYANTIDILTGGFPCQPYSIAGERKGTEDERHLWPEMLRAIKEIQPRWIVGENVHGLINWNGGLVFDEVQTDLEAAGYEVWPYVLPACAVNAPHRRDRIWFVAHRNCTGLQTPGAEQQAAGFKQYGELGTHITANTNGINGWPGAGGQDGQKIGDSGAGFTSNANSEPTEHTVRTRRNLLTGGNEEGLTAYTSGTGQQERNAAAIANGERHGARLSFEQWSDWPTQSPVCNGNDGISARLDTATISFSKWRNESIKAGGNAIVPQVALQIFRVIAKMDECYTGGGVGKKNKRQ